jgi:hypothetical protein
LSQPQFGHLVGIGMAINGDMRLGGPAPDQVTNTFSVTKTVLAWAILEAVRLGVFSDLEEVITVAAPPECGATPRSLLWMAHSWHQEPDMDALEVLPHDPLPLIVSAMGGPSYGTGSYVNAGMHVMIRELQHRTGSAAAFVDQTVLTQLEFTTTSGRWIPWVFRGVLRICTSACMTCYAWASIAFTTSRSPRTSPHRRRRCRPSAYRTRRGCGEVTGS